MGDATDGLDRRMTEALGGVLSPGGLTGLSAGLGQNLSETVGHSNKIVGTMMGAGAKGAKDALAGLSGIVGISSPGAGRALVGGNGGAGGVLPWLRVSSVRQLTRSTLVLLSPN